MNKVPEFSSITDQQLRTQLIDFAMKSGSAIAVGRLQRIVGAPETGTLDEETLAALASMHADDVNNCLVGLRVKMIGNIVTKNPAQLKYLNEWLDRAVQFLG
jgi:lysozyme family protein